MCRGQVRISYADFHVSPGGRLIRQHETSPIGCSFSWSVPRRFQPNPGELADQVSSPHIDVVLLDVCAHSLHARPALFRTHFERCMDGPCQLVGVVRIDHQSIRQLMSRSREAAQNQRTLLVVPRGRVLLGNQIHSVVQ